MRLWDGANAWGKSKHNLLKNAKGRLYYFLSLSLVLIFSKSKLSRSSSLVHVGNLS